MKNIILLIAAVLTFLSCTNTSARADQKASEKVVNEVDKNSPGYNIGDEAADFSLKNVDGEMVSLASYPEAKGFIVIFTCNHCPYSIAYEDRIIDLNTEYSTKGYPVIAINPNDPIAQPGDSYDLMKVRAEEKAFNFPYLFDEGQKIYPKFGATRTPHVYVLNKENEKNIVRYIGAIDNNHSDPTDVSEHYLKDAVDALIAGTEVTPNITKAIGCTIKVKK